MNITISQSEKINNILKHHNEIDLQNGVNAEKSIHLHGRKPLKIRCFANGDKFFQGKRISIFSHRYQNIDELLTELTNKMPPQVYLPNGIRQLFTTSSGRRIYDVNQIENGKDYVCAGNENFKVISYGKSEKIPWCKGRPHNFGRYPQLLPLEFGSLSQNLDPIINHKINDQSQYIGQNAFPSRFYKPPGLTYFTKNVFDHYASHGPSIAYPKLIKFKSRASVNRNVKYQDLLNQHIKPKVITIVRNGPEKPKGFVRILLNKRSVQSLETLISDIENSLREHFHKEMRGISKIYNLLGKEVKAVGDFFRNDEFFIAVGEHEKVGVKQVKEILDEMYPDHPQINHVLKYWNPSKYEEVSIKDDQDKAKHIYNSNMSVDKRDSGFEEQNFSKESEFNSFNNTSETNEASSLRKPKLSKTKPTVRKKKTISKSQHYSTSIETSMESENFYDSKKISENTSQSIDQQKVQVQYSDRLRMAYEEREKARLQLQEQLKTERRKLDQNIINNTSTYSKNLKKSISERGSIDVFKRMDEASNEARKQKLREKIDNNSQNVYNFNSTVVPSSSPRIIPEAKQPKELPAIESQIMMPNMITSGESNNSYSVKPKQINYNSSGVVGKLNKINEDPNENIMENKHNDINDQDILLDKSKKSKFESDSNSNRKKLEPPSQENNYSKHRNVPSELTDSIVNDLNSKEGNTSELQKTLANNIQEVKLDSHQLSFAKDQNDLSYDKKDVQVSEAEKRELLEKPLKQVQSESVTENEEAKDNSEKTNNISQKRITLDNEASTDLKTVNEKQISKKTTHLKSEIIGSRVMGKLCRQLSSSEIIYQRFEVTKLLGDGNFAIVKLAFHKKTKTEYALKIIDKTRMIGKESMIENEIWIMKLCNHENIVKLREEYETKDEVFLVMELVKNGDLFDAITQSVKFNEPVAARMVSDMANALFYLHSRRIVHRDLKPENLMVYRHKDGSITLKLADFGLAMEIKKLIYTVCGTPTYVAPEILTEKGYSLEVDLWALGVITYILLCGFPPFRSQNRDQEKLFEIIKSGHFEFISPYWDRISPDVKDLIRKLLVVDRKLRFTTIDVLSHKWLMTKGKAAQVSSESQKQRMFELEEEAKANLEDFQRQKKELRASINREIQNVYLINKR